MRLATAEEMAQTDLCAIEEEGIPSTLLMRRAAEWVAREALALCPEDVVPRMAVFAHTGKNGGDGVEAARILLTRGVRVRLFLTGPEDRCARDTLEMLRRFRELGAKPEPFLGDSEEQNSWVRSAHVVVDALFGTGFHGELRGPTLLASSLMGECRGKILAVDLPSGVETDTGRAADTAVRAHKTVTFTLPKLGQYLLPGAEHCGEICVRDIGIPESCVNRSLAGDVSAIEASWVARRLPQRKMDTHKGQYGKDFLLCGSRGMSGAAYFSASACVRMGAGLVTLATPQSVWAILAEKTQEVMVLPLPEDEAGRLSESALDAVLPRIQGADAVLLGPGLGRGSGVERVVLAALEESTAPLVLDADGINAAAGHIDTLRERRGPTVLTPHDGEFQRLYPEFPNLNRLEAARTFAQETGTVLLLKGPRTIVAAPDGRVGINSTGNPGMAAGGSGDVLSGVLLALLGQGLEPWEAACCAAFLHGRAGDLAAERLGQMGMTPTDLISCLPETVQTLFNMN